MRAGKQVSHEAVAFRTYTDRKVSRQGSSRCCNGRLDRCEEYQILTIRPAVRFVGPHPVQSNRLIGVDF